MKLNFFRRQKFARADVPVFALTPQDVVALLEGLPARLVVRGQGAGGERRWSLGPAPCACCNDLVVGSVEDAGRLLAALGLLTGRGLGVRGVRRA